MLPWLRIVCRVIRSKGCNLELYLENASFFLTLNGNTQALGPATNEFQHLALLLNGGTNEVAYVKNGSLVTTLTGMTTAADYSTSPWQLAAKGGDTPTDFYTGLIDEVAFFDTLVSLPDLQIHASPLTGDNVISGIDAGDASLLVHFPLDEGVGTEIEDYGARMTGAGEMVNGSWSIMAYRQEEFPHEFAPNQRVVNINPSNTAIGNIDFVDESTVQISGVVRFSNTFCYQDSVELYVNGLPAFPRIFTDSDGRFVGDFEPGRNIELTPVFTDSTHTFFPGFFETRKINRPIAGVLFQNTTKREIQGQMAGGVCRLSINYPERLAKIKIESLNGCFEKVITVEDLAGNYSIDDLPPIQYAVSVIDHFDVTNILPFFNVQGGVQIDLREMETDTVDFIYTAPPQVELEDFPVPQSVGNCGIPVVKQANASNPRLVKQDIRVFEAYRGGSCYLDTFLLRIQNEVADLPEVTLQIQDTSTYRYEYYPGAPNIAGDHLKTLTVTAFTPTGDAVISKQAVVLGARSRETTFTTKPYETPMFVLRDPPGDGSYASLLSGSTHCKTWSRATLNGDGDEEMVEAGVAFKHEVFMGTPGFGLIMDQEQSVLAVRENSRTTSEGEETVVETCVTFTDEYQTSDGDDILYHDADLFVGAAFNFEYGINDILSYNDTTCSFFLDEEIRIAPDSFSSTFIYSRWQIETDVIPSLELIGDTIAADRWRKMLEDEMNDKINAIELGNGENFTFDGLVNFSRTVEETKDSSASTTFELSVEDKLGMQANLNFPYVIENVEFAGTTAFDSTSVSDTSITISKEVTFVLADDDPNDNFSVNVFQDPNNETPVFELVAGESMCPWEPGTLNREEVQFSSDALARVNVPTNGQAVFNLQLSNVGQTGNDPLIYILGTVEGSNPDGAIIGVDGEGLTEPRAYQILPGETLEILLTVERGPLAFDYSELGIFMASECMWEHSRSLGYDLANSEIEIGPNGEVLDQEGPYYRPDLEKFYQELRLNVNFVEPCTPVNLAFPLLDWVVTPNDNNRLTIVLHQYMYDDPDLDLMRIQYRRVGGDGNWINIQEVPAAEILNHPISYAYDWDMSDLQDGPYEVRAVAQCTDVSLAPGISRFIPGRKETEPPALFGNPEPADGVLSPGDEISITFSKRIRCDQIFPADGIGTDININNLALIDATTGLLIDATISCNEDKIIIVPNIANQYIENRTLRAVVDVIQDLYGNQTEEIAWEFFVNRSNLYWDGGPIDEMVFEGNGLTTTRVIRNQSGEITTFNIEDIPAWMNVFPRQGSINPGEQMTINFEFPDNLPVDEFSTVVEMQTIDGIEPLPVDFRVTCESPDWSFNPAQYTFSMNLTVELDIEGTLSEDRVDIIAAFVDDELRGLANIQYNEVLASDPNGNPYLAFLTVYGNAPVGETVTFQIWDASDCILYGSTLESFPFEPDGLIGEPLAPQTIHTNNQVLRRIYLHPGWNWISYNLALADQTVDGLMETLTNPDETAVVKGQASFSQYVPGLDQWLGSLSTTDNFSTYQVKVPEYDSLTLVGRTIDPTQPIPVVVGWNWIGYLPNRPYSVTEALASLTPLNGDVVKSQFAFAQYVAGAGWIGNLNFMNSPNGYLLRISNAGNLIYPNGDNLQEDADNKSQVDGWRAYPLSMQKTDTLGNHWQVSPQNFEHGMNFIAIVMDEQLETITMEAGDELGVFVNGELRGADQVLYFPELDAHLIFLTAYANVEGEPLTFKFYDRSEDAEIDMAQLHPFQINQIVGSIAVPEIFHPEATISSIEDREIVQEFFFEAYPNPANDKLYLRFSAEPNEEVTLTVRNVLGQDIYRLRTKALASENILEWQPEEKVSDGFYFITIQRPSLGVPQTLKVELKRR
ncbi:MAG: LamG-like jellyroll fold domain-containing protein [Bacteroidota bacterium]